MPPVVSAIAVAIGTGLVHGLTAGLIAGVVTLAAGLVSMALTPKPKLGRLAMQPRLGTYVDPAAPREIVYGRVRKSTRVVYAATHNEYVAHFDEEGELRAEGTFGRLYLVLALAGHEIDGVEEIYFDHKIARNADGTLREPYNRQATTSVPEAGGIVDIAVYHGTDDQTADPMLMAALPAQWTAAHRLRGIAYLRVRLTFAQDVFSAVPSITAVVRGRKVYDPRTDTVAWSDNPALCLADYLADPLYGLGAQYGTEIDLDSLIAAANVCDELVEVRAPGGGTTTEKRYTCNGVVSSAEEPPRIIEALLSSMAGRLVYSGGRWSIHAGAYVAPTLTLDESDLRGRLQVQPRLARRDLCNAVRGLYLEPTRDTQPVDFPPVESDVFREQDGGETIWRDIELPFTQTATMAQRLARIELFQTREQITVSGTFGLRALAVRAGDTVALTNARMGWAAKPFLVTDWAFTVAPDDQGAPALAVALTLRETSPAVYDIDATDYQLLESAPDSQLVDPFTVAPPTGLILESGTAVLYVRQDGTIISRLHARWTAPADPYVVQGGQIEVQIKRSTDADWLPHAILPGDAVETYVTDVQDGVAYDVRVRAVNGIGATSAWVQVSNHVVIGKTEPPPAPLALSVRQRAGGAVEVQVVATPPVDWGTTELWRNSINDPDSATRITAGKQLLFTDVTAPVGATVYYFARLVDTSGNVSAFSPATANSILVTLIETDDVTPDAVSAGTAAKADGAIAIAAAPTWTTLATVILSVPAEGAEFWLWGSAKVTGGDHVEFRLTRDGTVLAEGEAQHAGAYTINLADIDEIQSQAFDPAAFDPDAFQTEATASAPEYRLEARNPGTGSPTASFRRLMALHRKR